MSISGSNEAKTTVFNVSTQETVSIDAQEDREILGYQVTWKLPAASDSDGEFRGHVGTNPEPAGGEVNDNRSFFVRDSVATDATNGYGAVEGHSEWFGDGSGFEWNEDATMNATLVQDTGDPDVVFTVYYREL